MFDAFMFYLLAASYTVCGIGLIVALGTTIYAMASEKINLLEALVFFVMVFLHWPEIVCDRVSDEIKWWWHEHISLEREERY